MKAIDTNILVRVITNDDKQQAKKAITYIKKQKEVFVPMIVLCETAWVLQSCYEVSKKALIPIIEKVLTTAQFVVEYSDAVWEALQHYQNGSGDFADCLIGATAFHYQCNAVITFDKRASKLPWFELI